MSSSKIFFYFCLSFIVGIFIALITKISLLISIAFFIFGLIFISVFWGFKKLVVFGACLIFLAFGFWQAGIARDKVINNGFVKYNLYGKDIVLEGVISKDPEIREKSLKLTIKTIHGKILITVNRYPEYKYNNKVRISGKLEIPPVFEDFNYKDYLLKDGIYAIMNFPQIKLANEGSSFGAAVRDPLSGIFSGILRVKEKARLGIQKNFSPPYSSILEGMILGDNAAMDNELKSKLNITGLRHIIAISGSHIVIISSILMSFLLMLGFWRGQAFYISIILISFFIILAGLPPSGVRAGIMGGIFLLAQKVGRKNASSRTIVMAAAFMLFLNPLLLFYDVGFQLSFLASMGIIYLSPIISGKLNFLYLKKQEELKNALSMTFSAQIFTLPILVFNFGSISLVSFITNILILPAVYLIMLFGFIFSILGVFSGFLAWIFSLPLWLLLTYFITIINLFSGPWAAKTIENVHWSWLVISYLLLFFGVRYLNKKQRLRFLDY